jgi:hypothetical protein
VPDKSAWIIAKSTIGSILMSSWLGRILFWVIVVGLALEIAMRLTGWIIFLPTQDLNREANLNAKIRILALGESTVLVLGRANFRVSFNLKVMMSVFLTSQQVESQVPFY